MELLGTTRTRLIPAVLGAIAAALATASPAFGHIGHSANGLRDGVAHPLTGPDHLLAMLAVGMVAATGHGARKVWVAPASFLGGMVAGGVAGLVGIPFPGAELLIVGSVILLGLVVAGALHERGQWVAPALVLAGLAHGHAHGAEAPTSAHPMLYVAGFVLATAALHLIGIGVGATVRDRRSIRVGLGVATVTAGALLLM